MNIIWNVAVSALASFIRTFGSDEDNAEFDEMLEEGCTEEDIRDFYLKCNGED